MTLLIREYIAMLRESGELDALLPDLLLNMGIIPVSRPQIGVRQHGVDVAAVGEHPEDNNEKLFLITIKPGDIGRSDWDGQPTAVRPSLDEILDVYIPQRVDDAHRQLPKHVILCCGGDLKQEVQDNWKGYKSSHAKPGEIEFELWDGDKLSHLIDDYFFDEYLFPPSHQGLIRKALALLDQNEEAPVFFYRLIEDILFHSDLPTGTSASAHKKRLKALRLLNLCLGVLIRWAREIENMRPALLAAERSVLRAWDFLRQHDLFGHKPTVEGFGKLYMTYLAAGKAYAARIQPLCFIKDGLSGGYSADVIEYPLRSFEALGFLCTLGINYAFLFSATDDDEHAEVAEAAAQSLEALIKNNPGANTPLFDGHAIEIGLGLILLTMTGQTQVARTWMVRLTNRIVFGYRMGRYFPVASDSYDDLLDLELGQAQSKEKLMNLSTLLPMLAEWYVLLGFNDDYKSFREVVTETFAETDLQLWYPDEQTEEALYRTNAGTETGATFNSISLPESPEVLLERMQRLVDEHNALKHLSCVEYGFPALGLIASRHFRTPVIPTLWQYLATRMSNEDLSGSD